MKIRVGPKGPKCFRIITHTHTLTLTLYILRKDQRGITGRVIRDLLLPCNTVFWAGIMSVRL